MASILVESMVESESKVDSVDSDCADIVFGDEEGSFFGLKMSQDMKYKVLLKANVCFSSFAVDPTTMEEDEHVTLWIKKDEAFALCSLTKKFPQYNAKFYFSKGSEFILYSKGHGTGYLCGYKTAHAEYD